MGAGVGGQWGRCTRAGRVSAEGAGLNIFVRDRTSNQEKARAEGGMMLGVVSSRPNVWGGCLSVPETAVLERFRHEMEFPSCLDAFKMALSWNLMHKQVFFRGYGQKPRGSLRWQIVHRFQVRIPVSQMVPIVGDVAGGLQIRDRPQCGWRTQKGPSWWATLVHFCLGNANTIGDENMI